METATCAASWKGVMESDTCGASRNSRHGMRNGKHQRSQNAALSECHGKVAMDGFMESNACATSWKGVMECVTETARRAASWKGVTQSDTCGASWNSRHGMRNGKH